MLKLTSKRRFGCGCFLDGPRCFLDSPRKHILDLWILVGCATVHPPRTPSPRMRFQGESVQHPYSPNHPDASEPASGHFSRELVTKLFPSPPLVAKLYNQLPMVASASWASYGSKGTVKKGNTQRT